MMLEAFAIWSNQLMGIAHLPSTSLATVHLDADIAHSRRFISPVLRVKSVANSKIVNIYFMDEPGNDS